MSAIQKRDPIKKKITKIIIFEKKSEQSQQQKEHVNAKKKNINSKNIVSFFNVAEIVCILKTIFTTFSTFITASIITSGIAAARLDKIQSIIAASCFALKNS